MECLEEEAKDSVEDARNTANGSSEDTADKPKKTSNNTAEDIDKTTDGAFKRVEQIKKRPYGWLAIRLGPFSY